MLHEFLSTKYRMQARCYMSCYRLNTEHKKMLHELLQIRHRMEARCYMSCYRLNTERKQDVISGVVQQST